jgi:Ca2+/Na+ antiporter
LKNKFKNKQGNPMRTFGWVFLVACLIDAVTSIIAAIVPALESLSDLTGPPVFVLAIVVFGLTCVNRLPPRRVFLAISAFFLGLVALGVCLGFILTTKLGASAVIHKPTVLLLREQFSWYRYVRWLLMVSQLGLSIYGIYAYRKSQAATKPRTPVDARRASRLDSMEVNGYRTAGKIFTYLGWFFLIGWISLLIFLMLLSDEPITSMTRIETARLCLAFLLPSGVSILYLIVGKGIKGYKEWARIVGIYLAILELFIFPIGTFIGGYTLWCLKKHGMPNKEYANS